MRGVSCLLQVYGVLCLLLNKNCLASLPRSTRAVKNALGLVKGTQQKKNRVRVLNSNDWDGVSDPSGERLLEEVR